jgi:hypothetical protein
VKTIETLKKGRLYLNYNRGKIIEIPGEDELKLEMGSTA